MSDIKERLQSFKEVHAIAFKMREAYEGTGNLAPLFAELNKALGDEDHEFSDSVEDITPEQTIVEIGFTAAYNNHDGTIGFLDTDSASGYPSFSKKPDRQHIYTEVSKAARDVTNIEGMKSYYGHDKIDFDTVRIVRYGIIAIEVIDVEEEVYEQNLASAREKLSDEELQALMRSAQPTG